MSILLRVVEAYGVIGWCLGIIFDAVEHPRPIRARLYDLAFVIIAWPFIIAGLATEARGHS